MTLLCQKPRCVDTATVDLSAQGTDHHLLVCSSDVEWAKEQLEQDFPAHRIEKTYTDLPVLTDDGMWG